MVSTNRDNKKREIAYWLIKIKNQDWYSERKKNKRIEEKTSMTSIAHM